MASKLDDLDSFDDSHCPQCNHPYNTTKHCPKFLQCTHTFCENCLQLLLSDNVIVCPDCNKSTSVGKRGTARLKDNVYVMPKKNPQKVRNETIDIWCETCEKVATPDCQKVHSIVSSLVAVEKMKAKLDAYLNTAANNYTELIDWRDFLQKYFNQGSIAFNRLSMDMSSKLNDNEDQLRALNSTNHGQLTNLQKEAKNKNLSLQKMFELAKKVKQVMEKSNKSKERLQPNFSAVSHLQDCKLQIKLITEGSFLENYPVPGSDLTLNLNFTDKENEGNMYHLTLGMIFTELIKDNVVEALKKPPILQSSRPINRHFIPTHHSMKPAPLPPKKPVVPPTVNNIAPNDELFLSDDDFDEEDDKLVGVCHYQSTNVNNSAVGLENISLVDTLYDHKIASKELIGTNQMANIPLYQSIVKKTDRPCCFMAIEIDGLAAGEVVYQLRNDLAPMMTQNFLGLCSGERGYGYAGSRIHLASPGEHLVGGDIEYNDGRGGYSVYKNRWFPADRCPLPDEVGALRMKGMCQDERGRGLIGSMFHIWVGPLQFKDFRFTLVFGKVIKGLDLCRKISHLPGQKRGKNFQIASKVIIKRCGILQ